MKLHTKTIVLILLLIISLICLLSYFFYTKYKFLIEYIDSRTDLKLEKFSSRYQLDSLNKINEQNYIDELKNNIINNDYENYFSKISNLSDIDEEEDIISENSDIYPLNNNLDKKEESETEEQEESETEEQEESETEEQEESETEEQEESETEEQEESETTPELKYQTDNELPNLANIDNYIENILKENENVLDTSLIEVEKKN